MKKVIRLTERQLEDIVRRVISEQQDERKPKSGYGLKQIEDNQTYNKFVNFDNGKPEDGIKELTRLSSALRNNYDLGYKNIVNWFKVGLKLVASTGITNPNEMENSDSFQRGWFDNPNYKSLSSKIKNPYEVLSRLTGSQLRKIS